MKLLLFSDLHCDVQKAEHLVERAPAFDVVVGAGDFACARLDIERTIDILQAISRPTVLVPGNNESYEELQAACRGWPGVHLLHGSGVEIEGISFFGLGGGVPVTPFGSWSYDFSDEEAEELLANCPASGVLVSHSPPHGAVDVSADGQHIGSLTVRKTIENQHPLLVVCGHIHDCSGQHTFIGETPIVNAGPDGVMWELSGS